MENTSFLWGCVSVMFHPSWEGWLMHRQVSVILGICLNTSNDKCKCIMQARDLMHKDGGFAGNIISYSAYCSAHRQADSGRAVFKPTSFLITNILHHPATLTCLFQWRICGWTARIIIKSSRRFVFQKEPPSSSVIWPLLFTFEVFYLIQSDSRWLQQQTNL